MPPIDRQMAQHVADPTLRHPLDDPGLYERGRWFECQPAKMAPRFLYAVRHEPSEGMTDRHWYEWIDTATGQRVEREDLCGFFEWCEGIMEGEARS